MKYKISLQCASKQGYAFAGEYSTRPDAKTALENAAERIAPNDWEWYNDDQMIRSSDPWHAPVLGLIWSEPTPEEARTARIAALKRELAKLEAESANEGEALYNAPQKD